VVRPRTVGDKAMRMPRVIKSLASVGLSMGVASSLLLLWGVTSTMPRKARAATGRPNIVFVLTDDMRKDDLRYMPKTRSLLEGKGMSFENAFVSNALCVPSRSTIMRGQYAHNTQVWTNLNAGGPDAGGKAYRDKGYENDNVAMRLDAAGYRTALIGKYLNGIEDKTVVPPGWDKWFATWGSNYFDYHANDQGTIGHFGKEASDYETDVIKRETKTFIGTSVGQGNPFFAYVAPKAPHGPAIPARPARIRWTEGSAPAVLRRERRLGQAPLDTTTA
jgi:N-acetylglucosamine-6-sulfatase